MAMADPTIDESARRNASKSAKRMRKAEVTLRNLPLPDVIATLPTELTSPPDLPVEKVCDALAAAAEETGLPPVLLCTADLAGKQVQAARGEPRRCARRRAIHAGNGASVRTA